MLNLGVIESECARCDETEFSLVGGFVHDVRCWGVGTALYNVYYRLVHAPR